MRAGIAAIDRPWRARLAARLGAAALALAGLTAPAPGMAAAPSASIPPADVPALAATPGPAADPRLRIVTLAPSATELVFAAGAGAQIVGTVLASDHPAAARAIPRVGDGIQFNAESILALKPDIVVGWQPSGIVRTLAATLAPLDIPLIYAAPRTLADIPREIRRLGARLGTGDRAERAAAELQGRIDALTPGGRPLTVFLEISAEPLYTLGNDPLINDLLARCGGINLYADSAVAAPLVSAESVLYRRPDVMIISPYGRETLASRQAFWRALRLPAALVGHIYAIDPDWLHRPGPRLVDAAEALCADLAQVRNTRP